MVCVVHPLLSEHLSPCQLSRVRGRLRPRRNDGWVLQVGDPYQPTYLSIPAGAHSETPPSLRQPADIMTFATSQTTPLTKYHSNSFTVSGMRCSSRSQSGTVPRSRSLVDGSGLARNDWIVSTRLATGFAYLSFQYTAGAQSGTPPSLRPPAGQYDVRYFTTDNLNSSDQQRATVGQTLRPRSCHRNPTNRIAFSPGCRLFCCQNLPVRVLGLARSVTPFVTEPLLELRADCWEIL